MNDYLTNARAMLRAVFAESLMAKPDRRALQSIARLDAALEVRSQTMAEITQRLARDL